MSDINEIMRQFDHGNGNEWKQFIKSIKVDNIHGWKDQEIKFRFPIVAIVGENGVGKSTFLKAAVCAYENKSGKSFYPSNMYMSTRWDTAALSGASISYTVRHGDDERKLKWKKTNDWGFSPKSKKPKRNVYFLDISRTLPLDATAGYAKIAKTATEETGHNVELNDAFLKDFSYVMGLQYSRARFTGTDVDEKHEVGLVTRSCGEISQFHQGAGEDSMLDMFKLLQNIPDQSLLVIDEVENSLHPQAQRRFIQFLLKLTRHRHLQVILSTHSPFVLDELPSVARIMLVKLSDRKDILYEISTEYALSTIDDKSHPELDVYLEDNEAMVLFWEILKSDVEKYTDFCKRIRTIAVGSAEIVNTLNGLKNRFPQKSIAIIDGDQKCTFSSCLSLPGDLAPEKQVLLDLKEKGWANLDSRFGIGAGNLFSILESSTILPDHHEWTTYIGDQIHKSKDAVWSILAEEWCKQCLDSKTINSFIDRINEELNR